MGPRKVQEAAASTRRRIYLLLAGVFFLLAMLGVALPGLPTTPFLLLTSYFLIRSSPALHAKLMASRRFGPLLENWHKHRGVTRRVKLLSVLGASAAVIASVLFGNLPLPVMVLVILLAAGGIFFVARLPIVEG